MEREQLTVKESDLIEALCSKKPITNLTTLLWSAARGTGITPQECKDSAILHIGRGCRVDAEGYLSYFVTPTLERIKVVS